MNKSNWSQLIQELRSEDVDRAVDACEKISELADETNVPELYLLLNDEDFFVREAAASPLARLEGVRALPFLFQAYTRGFEEGHDNDGLTITIVELLEENQEAVTPLLLDMLKSTDSEARANAAWALGFVAPQTSPVPLLELLDSEASLKVRAAATASLGSFKGSTEVFDKLISFLQDPSLHVKVAAIAALGYLGDKRAIGFLQEILNASSDTVKISIRYALERLNNK